ncbi:uncharacterized protein LOC112522403 isoform X1 [Cynara cardunculus var. scolymus]|uniref:uncharacterized protein LOC112522403 isoform X1 n=1 Tax=Cynara cardunculus var. scolymus TaxID=59895 RepID=UPI000D62E49D|nr:uncharacterized protein LOC112522403 isoform X1 [Cynara cardunculus var. scolymus]XP_024987269.1 uncharacterized protein LOC112522403 isoform X1 [Cynara cardunculus var. scolymus]XP_024987270.1 uncharacterized protein LOC112522403 isoform X1 [Cynara cardunculus var. scolymus]
MEDKQLNINQPLLSVRRFSSITASKKNESRRTRIYHPTMRVVESCKTELNSKPMKNTGSVPFGWEHSPGRPKDETDKQIQTEENPPSLPKLPPGWDLKPKRKDSDNITEEFITEYGSAKSAKKESSESGNDDDDDDTDEAFMDALDTLSRGESSFYNCSASGVSGLESAVKPSGILSADPKIRNFMMGRFLPAAKAMASEIPQNIYRKNVVKEKPLEVKKIANMDNKKVQLRYGPNFLQDIGQNNEEEDSDYDYDEHGNISSKLCGFLPRFCLKGSVGHVNPVSGTRTANRTHATSSSSISSFSETENEPARIAVYEHRSFDRSSVPETTNQNIYNRLQGCEISNIGSQSSVPERNNSSTQKQRATSFKELLADEKNKNETDGQDVLIEKTLYVDTVHMIRSPKEQSKFKADDTDMVADDEPKDDMKMETHMDQDPEEWIDDKNGYHDSKGSQDGVFELPAPPPLPKSPSDSWLWRTLPSVSSKNTAIRWNPKYPSSNAQIGHSEGPLLPIPER